MTLTVTHAFTSGVADDPTAAAAGEVLPSHWNAQHVVTGVALQVATGNITLFVSTLGSDSNDGTALLPFKTIQHAVNVISALVFTSAMTATIQLADGTYTDEGVVLGPWVGQPSGNVITIVGNNGTPTNVVLDNSVSGKRCITTSGPGALWAVHSLQVFNGSDLFLADNLSTLYYDNIDFKFGANTNQAINVRHGAYVATDGNVTDSCTISASSAAPFAFAKASVRDSIADIGATTYTINNVIDFTIAPGSFIDAALDAKVIADAITIVNPGNVHGIKFIVSQGGVLYITSTVANPIPGTVQGSVYLTGTLLDIDETNFPPVTEAAIDYPNVYRTTAGFNKINTTLADITGLVAQVLAGYSYEFTARLHVSPDAVGGHKYAIGGTCTVSNIIYQINSINNSTNAFILTSRQTALGGSAGVVAGTVDYTEITGVATVSGTGTLTAQFAQNVASGTSTVLTGSTLKVEALALPL